MPKVWVPGKPGTVSGSGMLFSVTPGTPGHWEGSDDPPAMVSAPPSNPVAAPAPTPPRPAPVLPRFVPLSNVSKNLKVAPSDIIQFDNDAVDIALIQQLLFEDIGAVELANISRSDLIDGQPAIYTPIANLSTVNREFNPNNIVATSNNLDYFSRFGLDLSSRGIHAPYFNENGDLVIEVDTVYDGEEIQVEILTNGTINLVGDV